MSDYEILEETNVLISLIQVNESPVQKITGTIGWWWSCTIFFVAVIDKDLLLSAIIGKELSHLGSYWSTLGQHQLTNLCACANCQCQEKFRKKWTQFCMAYTCQIYRICLKENFNIMSLKSILFLSLSSVDQLEQKGVGSLWTGLTLGSSVITVQNSSKLLV